MPIRSSRPDILAGRLFSAVTRRRITGFAGRSSRCICAIVQGTGRGAADSTDPGWARLQLPRTSSLELLFRIPATLGCGNVREPRVRFALPAPRRSR